MLRISRVIILIAAGVTGVASCSEQSIVEFHGEAGQYSQAGFGDATMQNTLVMNGDLSYVTDLANRFAREVDSSVTFAFNSAQLDAAARQVLARQAHWIRQFPEVRFRVYGHTDLVGSNSYNYGLGLRRAQAVVSFLATQGVGRSRLEAVVSKGETQPLIVTQGRERRNRRTVTEVTGWVEDNPLILDGKYAQIVYRDYVASAVAPSGLSDLSSGGAEASASQ
ncbi:OmpA family protein [Pseudooceanicola sp. C21-150M6]|uniref:OmpA family protein n=1 Tax=Pseudooceanicola sp. C21-150M6 TaxID=3434355 RepID=UPI003D7FE221